MARLVLLGVVVAGSILGALSGCGGGFSSDDPESTAGTTGTLGAAGGSADAVGGADSGGASDGLGGTPAGRGGTGGSGPGGGSGGDDGGGNGGDDGGGNGGTVTGSGGRDTTGGVGGRDTGGSGGTPSGGSGPGGTGGVGGSGASGSGGAPSGGSGGDGTGGGTGGDQSGGTGGTGNGGTGGDVLGGSGGVIVAGAGGEETGGVGGDAGSGATGGLPGSGGSTGDWGRCELTSQCVLRPASCCGTCGAATRDDFIALNRSELEEYSAMACEDVAGCDECYMVTDPFLAVTCTQGQCEMVDLTTTEITECELNTDCKVRTKDCCECGGGITEADLIAINREQEIAYSSLVCDPAVACLACLPQYPSEAQAVCSEGHCTLLWGTVVGG